MIYPPGPCSTCGSVLFWKRAGVFKCAKHQAPADPIGEQFYVTKEAMNAATEVVTKGLSTKDAQDLFDQVIKQATTEGANVATKEELVAAVAKALDSRLHLKPFSGQHASVTAVKKMTGPVSTGTIPGDEGRDFYGRKRKS